MVRDLAQKPCLTDTEGLATVKRLFHATFSTADRKEGRTAFVEKRKLDWTNV